MKKNRDNLNLVRVKNTFELPSLLVGMKTQPREIISQLKKCSWLALLSSGNLLPARCLRLMSGYQASKCITKYSIKNFFRLHKKAMTFSKESKN